MSDPIDGALWSGPPYSSRLWRSLTDHRNGEEAWWPLFDEMGAPLFPELMAEIDELKRTMVSGLIDQRGNCRCMQNGRASN